MQATRSGLTRRRSAVIGVIVATVAIVALITPTYLAGWAPLAHWTCSLTGQTSTQVDWVPISLANSPYGGTVFVNASVPSGPFGSGTPPLLAGGGETNGTVWGAFWEVEVTVWRQENTTTWGPGPNVRCSGAYSVSLLSATPPQIYTGEIFDWVGGPIFGPNSTTDHSEPTVYNLSSGSNASSLGFSNGFSLANAPSVTTCGSGPQSIAVRSSGLTVRIFNETNGAEYLISMAMPTTQIFHYTFPGDFGTWQIDNLSVPGGPGGGWAFSYAPCS